MEDECITGYSSCSGCEERFDCNNPRKDKFAELL